LPAGPCLPALALVSSHAGDTAAVIDERVAIIFGFSTLAFGLATVASCRSFVWLLNHAGLTTLARSAAFQAFYRRHGAYWFIFGGLLAAHLTLALVHTGLPQAGDPDAPLHWAILAAGLSAGLVAAGSFASCRLLPRLLTGRALDPAGRGGYRRFSRFHGHYWWLFVLIAAGHFAAAYSHAGIWPG